MLIGEIRRLMDRYKQEIRATSPKMYSKDLLETLFKHPYTKIEHLENDLGMHYNTANIYLDKLCEAGFLQKVRAGRYNYYINNPLYELFTSPVLYSKPQS